MMKTIVLLLAASIFASAQDVDMHWFGYTFETTDGTAVQSGRVAYIPVPLGCTLLHSWDLLINQPGTARVDVWRAPYPYWPTVTNSITNGSSPTITSGHHMYNANLSSWKTTASAHDVFAFNLDYITGGATQATIVMACQ